jgi:hypothetical protein
MVSNFCLSRVLKGVLKILGGFRTFVRQIEDRGDGDQNILTSLVPEFEGINVPDDLPYLAKYADNSAIRLWSRQN